MKGLFAKKHRNVYMLLLWLLLAFNFIGNFDALATGEITMGPLRLAGDGLFFFILLDMLVLLYIVFGLFKKVSCTWAWAFGYTMYNIIVTVVEAAYYFFNPAIVREIVMSEAQYEAAELATVVGFVTTFAIVITLILLFFMSILATYLWKHRNI